MGARGFEIAPIFSLNCGIIAPNFALLDQKLFVRKKIFGHFKI